MHWLFQRSASLSFNKIMSHLIQRFLFFSKKFFIPNTITLLNTLHEPGHRSTHTSVFLIFYLNILYFVFNIWCHFFLCGTQDKFPALAGQLRFILFYFNKAHVKLLTMIFFFTINDCWDHFWLSFIHTCHGCSYCVSLSQGKWRGISWLQGGQELSEEPEYQRGRKWRGWTEHITLDTTVSWPQVYTPW